MAPAEGLAYGLGASTAYAAFSAAQGRSYCVAAARSPEIPPCLIEFLDELIGVRLRLAFRCKGIHRSVAHGSVLENEPAKAPLMVGISLDLDDEWGDGRHAALWGRCGKSASDKIWRLDSNEAADRKKRDARSAYATSAYASSNRKSDGHHPESRR